MPLPSSLAHLKRGISEKKCAEARRWARGREAAEQAAAGHCQYLKWARSQPTAKCWWRPYRTQTGEHGFKSRHHWKAQQEVLWAEVRKETEKGKDRFMIRERREWEEELGAEG